MSISWQKELKQIGNVNIVEKIISAMRCFIVQDRVEPKTQVLDMELKQESLFHVLLVEKKYGGRDIILKSVRFFSAIWVVLQSLRESKIIHLLRVLKTMVGKEMVLVMEFYTNGLNAGKAWRRNVSNVVKRKKFSGLIKAMNIKESWMTGLNFVIGVIENLIREKIGGKQLKNIIFNNI